MTQEEIAVNAMKGILSGLATGGHYINPDDVTRKAGQVATAMKRPVVALVYTPLIFDPHY